MKQPIPNRQHSLLWSALREFYAFAPARQSLIFALMLVQGISAGVGLLFIVPLLQILGFDTGQPSTQANRVIETAQRIFLYLEIPITLASVLGSYVVIITLFASLRYLLGVESSRVQQRYIHHLRNKLFHQLINSQWSFIVQRKMSVFVHTLSGQVQSVGFALSLILTMLSQVVLALVMVGLASLISPQMTLWAAFFALLLLLLLLPLNRLVHGSGKRQLSNFKTIFQMLNEYLASLKMIKGYASEAHYAQKLQQTSASLEAQQLRLSRYNALTQWFYMVGAVTVFSVFFYTAHTVFELPLVTILLFLVIFSRLIPLVSGLQKSWQQLHHQLPAYADVVELLEDCRQAQEPPAGNAAAPLLRDAIRLDSVSFRYPGKEQDLFRDLSLTIPRNRTTAITGSSGTGKSTLADIIAGLQLPGRGAIYCDETELDSGVRIAWRQRVAYVTQEVHLFHESIRDNLNWVAPEPPSDEQLWQALRLAAADDFVRKLPRQLDTVIGDRGIQLSGGERQRLALARALLAEPQLLILDEATSALDDDNEKKIHQALESLHGKLTIIIIAHRETTIASADQRIDLSAEVKTAPPSENR